MTGVQFSWATGASFCCCISSSFILRTSIFCLTCGFPAHYLKSLYGPTPSLPPACVESEQLTWAAGAAPGRCHGTEAVRAHGGMREPVTACWGTRGTVRARGRGHKGWSPGRPPRPGSPGRARALAARPGAEQLRGDSCARPRVPTSPRRGASGQPRAPAVAARRVTSPATRAAQRARGPSRCAGPRAPARFLGGGGGPPGAAPSDAPLTYPPTPPAAICLPWSRARPGARARRAPQPLPTSSRPPSPRRAGMQSPYSARMTPLGPRAKQGREGVERYGCRDLYVEPEEELLGSSFPRVSTVGPPQLQAPACSGPHRALGPAHPHPPAPNPLLPGSGSPSAPIRFLRLDPSLQPPTSAAPEQQGAWRRLPPPLVHCLAPTQDS